MTCRICGSSDFQPFANLGQTPLADRFVDKDTVENWYRLNAVVCSSCKLVQLDTIVDKYEVFGYDYAFFTGTSPALVKHFESYAEEVKRQVNPTDKVVVEIASNDGTLLKQFEGYEKWGVEPTLSTAEEANKQGINTIVDYFDSRLADRIVDKVNKPIGLVLANNVLAHVEDLIDLLKGVKKLIGETGTFVAEVQYLPKLIFNLQYDHIYHEHLSYFTKTNLEKAYLAAGLYIYTYQPVATQGGSIRVFAKGKDEYHLDSGGLEGEFLQESMYSSFQARVNYQRQELQELIIDLKKKGKRIAAYGASAKSCTLINYCGVAESLDYILDETPFKFGKYAPGSQLKVISPEQEETPPDYYLLTVWNYLPAILEKEKKFRENGGKFILPLPVPQII